MRVISGVRRGRPLRAPRGMRTRPMADKIREAAFSTLWSLGIEPRRVLDLYAGSGSVGIEALSRGAEFADFVEQARDAVLVIRQNLRTTDLEDLAQVHQVPVQRFIESASCPYDFVIMDPPYAAPDIEERIEQLSYSGAVEDGTALLLGHAPYVKLSERVGRFVRLRERCHGDSCYSIFEIVAGEVTPNGDDEAEELG
jgi:16S rRNA (guanine966-N2)-methyltransferase